MTELSQRIQLLKALADSSRLMLVHALHQPQCVEELAQRCNLAPSTVCFHLGKLEKAGLVTRHKEQYYAVYALNEAVFGRSLRELTSFQNAEEQVQEERIQRYRAKVLHAFMKNSRVSRIPAQYKKRLIIMEEILQRFETERAYLEKEVDTIIGDVCDDYVTIRRSFIDEGMMKRNNGVYRVVRRSSSINRTSASAEVRT